MPSRGQVPGTSHAAHGRAGVLRAVSERARLRGCELYGVWHDHARTRARRLGPALTGIGAGRARNTSDSLLRLARATGALVTWIGEGRTGRLFCANGTRPRLGSRR